MSRDKEKQQLFTSFEFALKLVILFFETFPWLWRGDKYQILYVSDTRRYRTIHVIHIYTNALQQEVYNYIRVMFQQVYI